MSPGRDIRNRNVFILMKNNVPVHVAKLREAPKFALYQFGTKRCTFGTTAWSNSERLGFS